MFNLRQKVTAAMNQKKVAYYLLFAANKLLDFPPLTDCARHLVEAIKAQAQGIAGAPVQLLVFDSDQRAVRYLVGRRAGETFSFDYIRVHVMMNPGFLLADPPPIRELMLQVYREDIVWCGSKCSQETYAFGFKRSAISADMLCQAMTHLTASDRDDVETIWLSIVSMPFVRPAQVCPENSPALVGVGRLQARLGSNSPFFINRAIQEILENPQDGDRVNENPARMADALLAQRKVSRVPWIFNALVNEIEYRLGYRQPRSYPQEIHISLTGACNIECRFCAYTHAIARKNNVRPQQIARLDFLRHVQAVRLHSGLGEPTMNPHLTDIIDYISDQFPHIEMNFFTNAVALNRHGCIPGIIGKVKWINASLNAATRNSWKELCNADLFNRVCENLKVVHRVKQGQGLLWPLVFGSMVLTSENVTDLPRMPALCRDLGIDRFSAMPFFALGYSQTGKYGSGMTLEGCRNQYARLYEETISEARKSCVSIELPLPKAIKETDFGMEVHPLHDFARIEMNQWKLARFTRSLKFKKPAGEYCRALWSTVAVGSTNNTGHSSAESHYMYPCVGPLSSLDLSRKTAFRFPDEHGFLKLWNNPVFSHLRQAQHKRGICAVCDECRTGDTRDPVNFSLLESLVGEFSKGHCGVHK